MAVQRFEYEDEKSHKFWEIEVKGNIHRVRYGRIGSDGQSKEKSFDSPEQAQRDADKLIAQKTKKGYQGVESQEARLDGRVDVDTLIDAEEPSQALFDYLKPLMTQSAECEELLRRLVATARDLSVYEDASLEFYVLPAGVDENDEDDLVKVIFQAPFTGKVHAAVPPSMAAFCRHHNGVTWERYLDFSFYGLGRSGGISEGGWESEALEEAGEDNADFLAELADAGMGPDDVCGPIDYGQNWLILHPAKKNALGEDALYFVSHGNCEAVEVKRARDLGWGPIMLRVMVQDMFGRSGFGEVYD